MPSLLAARPVDKAVIWLDELNEFLNVENLRTDWVQLLIGNGCLVVASMRNDERANFVGRGELRRPQAAVLEQFHDVRVPDDNKVENKRLAKALKKPKQRETVRETGLGAFLGGGPVAKARLEDSRDIHPLGWAMVRTAADWRRVGLSGITRAELEELAPHYLPNKFKHEPGETPDDALLWATERLESIVQLLEPRGCDTYICSNYILDYLSEADDPVLAETWDQAIRKQDAHPGELFNLGFAAFEAHEPNIAIAAFDRVASSEHADDAPLAAYNLGLLEHEQGDPDSARTAYQLAIDSEHPDHAPLAANNLGILEHWQGNLDSARTAYQFAIDSEHPDEAPSAALSLALLEEDQSGL